MFHKYLRYPILQEFPFAGWKDEVPYVRARSIERGRFAVKLSISVRELICGFMNETVHHQQFKTRKWLISTRLVN